MSGAHGERWCDVSCGSSLGAGFFAVLLGACVTHSIDYTGLACDAAHPCPAGFVCGAAQTCSSATGGGGGGGGATGGGGTGGGGGGTGGGGGGSVLDAGCPFDVDPAASACAGTDWYLSPTGSDTSDGKSPATAHATLTGLTLAGGDVVHFLGGAYPQHVVVNATMSGSASCPILFAGEPDGGSVLTRELDFNGAYLVFRDLVFNPQNENGIDTDSANHVTFQRDVFRSRPPGAGHFPYDLHFHGSCNDCTIRESTFECQVGVHPIEINGTNARVAFRGNRILMREFGQATIEGTEVEFSGNDVSGTFAADPGWMTLDLAPGARVHRNVFHDVVAYYPDKYLLYFPGEVINNTFARVSGNDNVPLVVDAGVFADNLVTTSQWVVGGAEPASGSYNLFDPSVTRPFADSDGGALRGTDRIAAVDFDPGWVPLAASAAIDSADPSLPVPPGGGARADIGAVERGAKPIADGRYCLPDGGNP